ncbi:hypothetical protein GQ600_15701 [Phytophthora cactorum]|nr:hypothetical protein GQ600_15701 [Phytophthora cactorum]
MDNGILCPPHSQHLSDSTIGEVILRSNVRRHDQTISARYFRGGTIVGAEAPAQIYSQTDPWSLTGSSARSAFVSTDKRIRTALTTLCVKMPSHTIPPELLEAMVQSEAKVREQRRVTQQRYRKKMDQRTKSLENDTLRLQEEIHRLELQYNCLISQTPTEETPWSVVAEYYRLFRYGSQVPESTKQALYLKEAQIQTNFLHRTMAQTISVNSGFGIDALLQEWRFVPRMAGDLTVQLLRLEYDDRAAMLATVKVFVTITERYAASELLTPR